MSDNQDTTPTAPVRPLGGGRVRALSQHFETLSEMQERLAKRYRGENEGYEVVDVESLTAALEKKTVLTGEYREPLSERIRARREAAKDRARQESGSGGSSPVVDTSSAGEGGSSRPPSLTPSTPVRAASQEEPECPGCDDYSDGDDGEYCCHSEAAKARERESREYARKNDDILTDRLANEEYLALTGRSFIDLPSARQQQADATAPYAPSPLRQSFSEALKDEE
ncbi:hypothetical protein Hte_004015 [Hypoxylon texense]